MHGKVIVLAPLCVLAATLSSGKVLAGSVEGMVRDKGGIAGQDELSGATAQLRYQSGKLTETEITDTDGRYNIPNVANGRYTLVVTMAGFVPYPHDSTNITVRGDHKAIDVLLMKKDGSENYYSAVADGIIKKASLVRIAERPKVFVDEWNGLQFINLPPSSKILLAKGLNKRDTSAKDSVEGIGYYLSASPEDVAKAQTLFRIALTESRSLPDKSMLSGMRISDAIVAEVFLSQLKESVQSEEKQKVFVKEFLDKWIDTPASNRFLYLQKLEFSKGKPF